MKEKKVALEARFENQTHDRAFLASKPKQLVDVSDPKSERLNRYQSIANQGARPLQMHGYQSIANQGMQEVNSKGIAQLSQEEEALAMPPLDGIDAQTGLPLQLKANMEALSGCSLDGVQVHYDASLPDRLDAHAAARGKDIFISRGQQQYLPHETWHVVQQMQGRVAPTAKAADGTLINDDPKLEAEADEMGAKAANLHRESTSGLGSQRPSVGESLGSHQPAQRMARSIAGNGVVQLGKKTKEQLEKEAARKKEREEARNLPLGKKRALLLEKLKGSYLRNLAGKAKPRKMRRIFDLQKSGNYGFPSAEIAKLMAASDDETAVVPYQPGFRPDLNPSYSQISMDGLSGFFRKGMGGQPYLTLNKSSYDDPLMKSNYDEIIAQFKGADAEIALEILEILETGKQVNSDKNGQAISLFILLTQTIEAHSARIPGIDKLARALLRRIALGQLTFKQAFNRKDGLFVAAWAKSGKAPKGGQVAGRALFGIDKPKDKFSSEDLFETFSEEQLDELFETIDGYYSEESDDEEEEESGSSGSIRGYSAELDKINAALEALGIDFKMKNLREVINLGSLRDLIKKQYHKLAVQNHPDKGGNVDTFNRISEARQYLDKLAGVLKDNDLDGLRDHSRQQHLQQAGLELVRVMGDGNCFYSAILHQLYLAQGINVNAAFLRQCIAQLILDNAAHFRIFVAGNQLDRIINDILTDHSWRNAGGDFAPQLIATVLQRRVVIMQPQGPLVIDPIGGLVLNQNNTFVVGNSVLTITYDGVGHYDSTRNIRLQIQNPF